MARTNAKRELLAQIDYRNLIILKIECTYISKDKIIICNSLEDLDFYYDNNYGGYSSLNGKVYCIVKETGNVAWLERRDYDGRNYWHLNEVPLYLKDFIINNNTK